jgi:tetratricopeptide (TPR) repeat protein
MGKFSKKDKIIDKVTLAATHHDRGIDYCYIDRDYDKALIELREACVIRESVQGKFHHDTQISYFRIASVLKEEKHDFKQALVIARRELRISQGLLWMGKGIQVANSSVSETNDEKWLTDRLLFIQSALRETQQFSEREVTKYCGALLQSIEYERLGNVHFQSKRFELAIQDYNCAVALERSCPYAGGNTLDMADIMIKIGDCLFHLKDYQSALEEYQSAQATYELEFETNCHGTIGTLHSKMGGIFLKQRDYDQALASYCKAYTNFEHVCGKENSKAIECLQDIRLVTVKEIEDLRIQERLRIQEEGSTNGDSVYSKTSSRKTHNTHRESRDEFQERRRERKGTAPRLAF